MGLLLFICVFLLLLYTILILFYRAAWRHLPSFTVDKSYEPSTTISIIIPARNEAKNIASLLKCISRQFYPSKLIEVIVMDDHSSDETVEIVKTFPNVQCFSLATFTQGQPLNAYKKKAIEMGIANSRGELIITTDADCSMDDYWLLSIVQYYELNHPQMIAAPVAFNNNGSWFQTFQSLDFTTMQGITAAVVSTKNGNMCNGANLAYTRTAFDAVNGFTGVDTLASGDDVFLMQKIQVVFPDKIAFLKCKEAIVKTVPMLDMHSFFQQRSRWASKATAYKDNYIKAALALVYSVNLLFLVLGIFAFFKPAIWFVFFILLGLKIIVELSLLTGVAQFFDKQKELRIFSILQFIHIPYILIAGFLGLFGSYQWKNRQVN